MEKRKPKKSQKRSGNGELKSASCAMPTCQCGGSSGLGPLYVVVSRDVFHLPALCRDVSAVYVPSPYWMALFG